MTITASSNQIDDIKTSETSLSLIIHGGNNQICVDSRDIPKEFKQEHKSVLRTIDDLIADGEHGPAFASLFKLIKDRTLLGTRRGRIVDDMPERSAGNHVHTVRLGRIGIADGIMIRGRKRVHQRAAIRTPRCIIESHRTRPARNSKSRL